MADLVVIAFAVLGFFAFALFGLIALIAPRKAIAFQEWASRVRDWPKTESGVSTAYLVQLRIAGAIMALIGGTAVAGILSDLAPGLIDTFASAFPEDRPERTLFSLVLALALSVAGVHALVNPKSVAMWAGRQFPGRVSPDPITPASLLLARLFGAFMILGAVMALAPWIS